jgi:hypothetical protein
MWCHSRTKYADSVIFAASVYNQATHYQKTLKICKVIKVKTRQLLFIIPLLFLFTSCDKRQSTAEELVRNYLNEHLADPGSYKSHGFSDVVKLKDRMFPGAKAPLRAYGRWEIVHTYSFKNANGAPVTETKVFEIDSAFTVAQCCYAKMSDLR